MNAALQVFDGAVIVGALGKMTTLIVLLDPHQAVPTEPAAVEPQAEERVYRAIIE